MYVRVSVAIALQRTKYTQAIPKQLNSAAIACRACAALCGTSPHKPKQNTLK